MDSLHSTTTTACHPRHRRARQGPPLPYTTLSTAVTPAPTKDDVEAPVSCCRGQALVVTQGHCRCPSHRLAAAACRPPLPSSTHEEPREAGGPPLRPKPSCNRLFRQALLHAALRRPRRNSPDLAGPGAAAVLSIASWDRPALAHQAPRAMPHRGTIAPFSQPGPGVPCCRPRALHAGRAAGRDGTRAQRHPRWKGLGWTAAWQHRMRANEGMCDAVCRLPCEPREPLLLGS